MGKKKCGAKAKSTGKPCKNPAGFKTSHPGEGRCYLHGGGKAAKDGKPATHSGRPPTTFRYTSKNNKTLKETYEKAMQDSDVFNLRDEIALLRAKLQLAVESSKILEEIIDIADRKAYINNDFILRNAVLDLRKVAPTLFDAHLEKAIAKLTKTLHEIEVGRKYVVEIENIQMVINQVVMIVARHIQDTDTRRAIAEDLSRIVISIN